MKNMVARVSSEFKLKRKNVQNGQFNFSELLGDINFVDGKKSEDKPGRKSSSSARSVDKEMKSSPEQDSPLV